jgi:protocatechuate 3,4-dioxygenase, beta subunit
VTSPTTRISRRAFAGGAVALLAGGRALAEPALTAESPFGPFYPIVQPMDADADLTRVAGRSGRAKGQIIEVVGRVLDRFGRPVEGARLELWQANAAGRYDHANDPATAPLDPDFQGYASLVTGADGGWKITTVKPAAYGSPIGVRTPHIHFDVRGRTHRLPAQMYFADEAKLNAEDTLFRDLGADAPTSVAALVADHRYRWDVVLMDG